VLVERDTAGAIALGGFQVSTSHAADITVALTRADGPVAIDLQFEPAFELDEWRLMLGEARMHFAMQLSEQEDVPLQQSLLAAWTASECLIKLGYIGWPLTGGGCRREETSQIGTLLVFHCSRLRLAIASLSIAGASTQATLAIAIEDGPAMHEAAQATVGRERLSPYDASHI
jgi:hypothetical protein